MSDVERRAPVQKATEPRDHDARLKLIAAGAPGMVPGTVSWAEHLAAYAVYHRRHPNHQTAERIAERSGFCYAELTDFLGHPPTTWEPRP